MKSVRAQLVLPAIVALAGSVHGQELPPRSTVAERERPEVDGVEHRLGAFDLATTLAFGNERDDNVFAERTAERADHALWLEPAFRLESDWSRHALSVAGDMRTVNYDTYSTEDHDDNGLRAAARLDVRERSSVSLSLSDTKSHEGRESPDGRGGDRRTPLNTDITRLTYTSQRTRLRLDLETQWTHIDFDDTFRSRDSAIINNDDRDRRERSARARVGYEMAASYGLFVQAATNDRSYDQLRDDAGFNRNSNGWDLVLGVALDRSGIVFGDLFAGYRRQDFDDSRFETVKGPTFGADVTWNLTDLTTITAIGERALEDTTIVRAAGIESTRFRLTADHELRRNVIVSMTVASEEEDFQGVDQTDDIRSVGLSVRYLPNRRLHVIGGFRSERRSSAPTVPSAFVYSKDVYFVQLQGHL
jgi:hypothetical protein